MKPECAFEDCDRGTHRPVTVRFRVDLSKEEQEVTLGLCRDHYNSFTRGYEFSFVDRGNDAIGGLHLPGL